MDSKSQTRKLILFLFVFVLTVSIVNAASLSVEEDVVWENDYWMAGHLDDKVFDVTCSGDFNLTYEAQNSQDSHTFDIEEDLKVSDIHNSGVDFERPESSFVLSCTNKTDIEKTIQVRKLDYTEIDSHGEGFVGSVLNGDGQTTPIKISNIELVGEALNKDLLSVNFESGSELVVEKTKKIELSPKNEFQNSIDLRVHPRVREFVYGETVNLVLNYDGEGVEKLTLSPKVHDWRVGNIYDEPSRQINLRDIESGAFKYRFDAVHDGVGEDVLTKDNFRLTISKVGGSTVESNRKWLDVMEPTGQKGNYIVKLGSLPTELETGSYIFEVDVVYDDGVTDGSDRFRLDRTYVDNQIEFSGAVRDSRTAPVRTNMILKRDGRKFPVSTSSDGIYSTHVKDVIHNAVNLYFYDRGRQNPDASFTVGQVDLANLAKENSIGESSEAISFDYWDNPSIDLNAVNPVNMMAVKFAHDTRGSVSASMKYDSKNVDPADLKVFECNHWNFKGKKCLSEWTVLDGDKVSVSPADSTVTMKNLTLHHISEQVGGEEKDMLINAYIVGTSADLRINNRPSVTGTTGGKVETGGEITVSGRIISENENFVEGANVTVEFWEGDSKVDSLDTAPTDITGQFSASGKAPEEPGNYSLVVKADKERYNSFEKKYRNRFEVFIKEGIGIEAESPLEVPMGKNKTTEITVENIGQTEMKNVELQFEGLSSAFYSISKTDLGSIKAGEKKVTALTFKLPSTYCSDSSCTYPTVDVAASAENGEGDVFEDSKGIQTQLTNRYEGSDQKSGSEDTTKSGQSSSSQENNDNSGSGFDVPTDEIERATGEFIASQSSLNIALGLIMVFMMVMAGAIKKQKSGGGSGRRSSRGSGEPGRGERPRVQKPSVGGDSTVKQVEPRNEEENYQESDQVESHVDAIADSIASEDESGGETKQKKEVEQESTPVETSERSGQGRDKEKYVCEETGEEFDTKAALKMHKKMNGIK